VRKAVADSVPASFRELNLKAFERGFEYGSNTLVGAHPKAEMDELEYSKE
jgi:Pyruvate/2-oxoacid:ferredoxin oxidoreductase gamma subunit